MIYRVVERYDGTFQCQMRVFFFFWSDSCHAPSRDLAEQIEFARPDPKERPTRAVRVVWP